MTQFLARCFTLLFTSLLLPLSVSGQDWHDAEAFPVSRVVDGDTVEILMDGSPTKVRLIGVDTPETVHPQKPVEYYGREASLFLQNLLRGESVYVTYDQDRQDKYGRLLAYLYRAPDGLFVNAEIIRQGYGHAYTTYPFQEDLMERFRGLQRHAMEAGKGLWAGTVTPQAVQQPAMPTKVRAPASSASQHKHHIVYVTKSGTKYHADGCRYLKKSKRAMPLEEAKSEYSACKVCKPTK